MKKYGNRMYRKCYFIYSKIWIAMTTCLCTVSNPIFATCQAATFLTRSKWLTISGVRPKSLSIKSPSERLQPFLLPRKTNDERWMKKGGRSQQTNPPMHPGGIQPGLRFAQFLFLRVCVCVLHDLQWFLPSNELRNGFWLGASRSCVNKPFCFNLSHG